MLKPVRLQKVRLIGLIAAQAMALELWQQLGVMHLTIVPAATLGLQEGKAIDEYDEISTQLVRLRAIKNALNIVPVGPAVVVEDALTQAASIQIEDELLSLRAQLERLDKHALELAVQKKMALRLAGLEVDFATLPSALDYYLLSVPTAQLAKVRNDWQRHSWHAQWLTALDPQNAKSTIALVAVPKGVDCSGAMTGMERLPWPTFASVGVKNEGTAKAAGDASTSNGTMNVTAASKGNPRNALLKLEGEMLSVDHEKTSLKRRLAELSKQYYPICTRLEEALSIAAEMAQASGRFGRSEQCFYAEGWIRPEHVQMLRENTTQRLGERVVVQVVPEWEHHGLGMPTVLDNPAIAGPFQFLLEFMGRPKADELDPTMILFFTVPLFYGLIMGDAGYALVSFLLAWLIVSKVPKEGMLGQFSRIWMMGAVPSLVFGVLFDEYFGLTHQQILGLSTPLYHAVLHRMEDMQTLLLVSILVGWVHVALGFILGAINEWGHNRKHAYAKLAWLPIQVGGTLAVMAFMLNAASADLGMAGLGMLAIGAAVLAWAEGPTGLVEIPGLSSNILSYMRIGVVGVVGVIMADIINRMATPNLASLQTPGGIVVFILTALVYTLAHVANTALAMFESLMHGARLNVVEFFGKFYHGGGIAFQPFAAKREFTLARKDEKSSQTTY
jgi:V/A-type H+-transporting ATPase subunit I